MGGWREEITSVSGVSKGLSEEGKLDLKEEEKRQACMDLGEEHSRTSVKALSWKEVGGLIDKTKMSIVRTE